MSNVSTAVQMWNHVVTEQGMKSLPIGKKYSCEEEWWHSLGKLSKESCPIVDDNTPREELDTWKERQKMAFGEQKKTWIEQVNEQGEIFIDLFLHSECEFIRVVKKDEETSKEKRKQ